MVIVKIKDCICYLNDDIKQKIVDKQNDVGCNIESNDLLTRLTDHRFIQLMIQKLSPLEKQYFPVFIQKFAPILTEQAKEEHCVSTEEKLALLLLRQKGIIYKLETSTLSQQFIIPIEFVTEYFKENNLSKEMVREGIYVDNKKYLFALLEIIFHLKERKPRRNTEVASIHEELSNEISLDFVLEFLEANGLIQKNNGAWLVNEGLCDSFFQKACGEIKDLVMIFYLKRAIDDRYAVLLIHSLLLHSKQTRGVNIVDLQSLIKGKKTFDKLRYVLDQLAFLDVVVKQDEEIFLVPENDHKVDEEQITGIELGSLACMIPIFIDNGILWQLKYWGDFKNWDTMTNYTITKQSVKRALLNKRPKSNLQTLLGKIIPEGVFERWQPFLEQLLQSEKPLQRKREITFFSVTGKLHVKYIEEHWQEWKIICEEGVFIETEMEKKLEKLLGALSLTISDDISLKDNNEQFFSLQIVNEFPDINKAFPELSHIPRQWFSLTAYDEKMMQRIVKQAIVLRVRIKIEISLTKCVTILPVKLSIENGFYEIINDKNKRISFVDIKRIAILHPLE